MEFKKVLSTPLTAAKLVLAFTSPIQTLIDQLSLVHDLCNQQAMQILKNDGFITEAEVIAQFLDQIDAGTAWADEGGKYMAHYHNPITGKGCKGWLSAGDQCAKYLELAINEADRGEWEQTFFYLGAAGHLVQDLCVPYHAHNILFSGHHHYEKWAEEYAEEYLVDSGGIYSENLKTGREWVQANAKTSYDLIPLLLNKSHNGYKQATKRMLPRAQKTSAGFFKYFLDYTQLSEKVSRDLCQNRELKNNLPQSTGARGRNR